MPKKTTTKTEKKVDEQKKETVIVEIPTTGTHAQRARLINRLMREYHRPEASFEQLEIWLAVEETRSWPREMTRPLARALYEYDPQPLRQWMQILGFVMLTDPLIQKVLNRLWSEHFLKTDNGRKARKCLTALFKNIGALVGPPELPSEAERKERKKSSTQQSKKLHSQIYQETKKELETLMQANDPRLPEAIRGAVQSKDKAKLKAALSIKKKIF